MTKVIDKENELGYSLLALACRENNLEKVKHLLECKATITPQVFYCATDKGNKQLVNYLLDSKVFLFIFLRLIMYRWIRIEVNIGLE
jgi:hypothetical protein